MRLRPLLAVLALAVAPLPAAHADPLVDTVIVLQGSLAHACYGCGTTATFQGVATVTDPGGVETLPATGEFDTSATCDATGWAAGMLHFGGTDYQIWLSTVGAAAEGFMFGPNGGFEPWFTEGTVALDAPPGTCGMPLTATVDLVFEPGFNCACYIGGGDG